MTGFLRVHFRQFAACWLLVACVCAFAVLLTGNSYWTGQPAQSTRLLVASNALSPQHFLPRAYVSRIQSLEGVSAVTELSAAMAWLAKTTRPSALVILDKQGALAALPELHVEPDSARAWQAGKDQVLLSAALSDRLGLVPGDRVNTQLVAGGKPIPYAFVFAGRFESASTLGCEYCLLAGRDFADEALPGYRGLVSSILIQAVDADAMAAVASRVDARFAGEAFATRTAPYSADAGARLREAVDLRGFALYVIACVMVTATLVPGLVAYLNGVGNRGAFALLLGLGFARGALYRAVVLQVIGLFASAAVAAFGLTWLLGRSGWAADAVWLRLESPWQGLAGSAFIAGVTALGVIAAVGAALRGVGPEALFEED